MTVAALPMYDLLELREATDAFWSLIAKGMMHRGYDAPAALTRGMTLDALWTDPALLLGQTCGYPLVTSLKGSVQLLTTPCYVAPGCDGAAYRSAIVVRASDPAISLADLHGRRCAVNDPASNSGMNLLRAKLAPLAHGQARFFSDIVMTGAHEASVAAVAEGRADVAAIDCITWAHLQRLRPAATRGLRVLDWTPASPGLPFITALGTDAKVRKALLAALDDASGDELLIEGFVALPIEAYDPILRMEHDAAVAGYPVLV